MWIYSRKQLNRIVKKATKKALKENNKIIKEYENQLRKKDRHILALKQSIELTKVENKLDNIIYNMENFYLKKHEYNDKHGGKN